MRLFLTAILFLSHAAVVMADGRLWVNAVRDNGRWIVMETGKPAVILIIGDQEIRTDYIEFGLDKAPPFRGGQMKKLWENKTPGIYRVRYHK